MTKVCLFFLIVSVLHAGCTPVREKEFPAFEGEYKIIQRDKAVVSPSGEYLLSIRTDVSENLVYATITEWPSTHSVIFGDIEFNMKLDVRAMWDAKGDAWILSSGNTLYHWEHVDGSWIWSLVGAPESNTKQLRIYNFMKAFDGKSEEDGKEGNPRGSFRKS